MRSGDTIISRNSIIARRYLIASMLLAAGGAVYELFSHGVYSYYMIYAFMIPLALGALTHLADSRGYFTKGGRTAEMILLAAVATLSIGSVMKGVLEIYGTTNTLLSAYPVAGVILLAAALIYTVIKAR